MFVKDRRAGLGDSLGEFSLGALVVGESFTLALLECKLPHLPGFFFIEKQTTNTN